MQKEIYFFLLILFTTSSCGKIGNLFFFEEVPASNSRPTIYQTSVPAFTAYISPMESPSVSISETDGIINWKEKSPEIKIYVKFNQTGTINLDLLSRLPHSESARLHITLAGESKVINFNKSADYQQQKIGEFSIPKPGYYEITLKGIDKNGRQFPDIKSFVLSGEIAREALFNSKPRKNAASVHLRYPIENGQEIEWFYNEIRVPKGMDPVNSYFMSCGFHRGYFGMQVISPTERKIIFSVWDSGNETIDTSQVKDEDKVKLLAKGKNVFEEKFAIEGTGNHCLMEYDWSTEITYKFLIHAEPKGTSTIHTAYFLGPETGQWQLVAKFKTPKDGKYLNNLYAFVENFEGENGELERKATFSNPWVRTSKGDWIELTKSYFSHDETGKKERQDYGGGVKNGEFFLFNGGFKTQTAIYGDEFNRQGGTGQHPNLTELPKIPQSL
ncbi:DUF3472 domain-containing protein [Flexithrix dorotheae]|uniref:DUF3472 domain-containing protein n=1 Tax=Flexithrix dorotheae TaxID=70993 RepID=UPI00037AFB79|nr:DUF3472 domain-containing protein [Flexithrix dorotheae]